MRKWRSRRLSETLPVSDAEKKEVRAKLEEFRTKILAGKTFAVYAALYSQDQGSAKRW